MTTPAPQEPPTDEVEVVVVKDYPRRNLLVALAGMPFFMLLSGVLVVPFFFVKDTFPLIIPAVVMTAVAELLVLWWGLRYTDKWRTKGEALALHRPRGRYLFMAVGAGLLLLLGLQVLSSLLQAGGFTIDSSDTSKSIMAAEGPVRYLLLFLLVPLLIPFVEELFFRGLLFGAFRDAKEGGNLPLAYIGSAVTFAFAHFQGLSSVTDVALLFWIFVTGLTFAHLRHTSGSLWTSYAAHATYNLATVVLSLVAASLGGA